jgi:hypothetical protein
MPAAGWKHVGCMRAYRSSFGLQQLLHTFLDRLNLRRRWGLGTPPAAPRDNASTGTAEANSSDRQRRKANASDKCDSCLRHSTTSCSNSCLGLLRFELLDNFVTFAETGIALSSGPFDQNSYCIGLVALQALPSAHRVFARV